jgi:glycosyltransferase involved in cell wall biosynthesis
MKISVVIPCYNSEKTIKNVVSLARDELIALGYEYEFILVNDNSKDRTFEQIAELCQKDQKIKGINLSRNFGQHNALIAGLNYITGDYVIGMDDDMQTHPSQLKKLITKFNDGFDIVFGKYAHKKHAWYRNLGSKFNLWTVQIFTGRPKNLKTSSYWIAKRFVCDEAIKYKNPYPNIQGLFFRVTQNVADVELEHFERQVGKSNYTFKKLVKLWSSMTNFSIIPLRAALLLGIVFGILGILGAVVVIINKLTHPETAMGWSSVMVVTLIASGINLVCIGIVGEYVGRLFMADNNAPQYIIKEKLNCNLEEDKLCKR